MQQTGVITVSIPNGTATSGTGFSFPLPAQVVEGATASTPVIVSMLSGEALPAWLKFNAQTKVFSASAVPEGGFPIQVLVIVGQQRTVIAVSERSE